MGQVRWTIIVTIIVGAIIGAVIGFLVGQSMLGSAMGALIGIGIVASGLGLNALVPAEVWLALAQFGQVTDCCLSFGFFSLASIVSLGGLLLWHSLALAALAGVGVMTVLSVVLSVGVCSFMDVSAPVET